MKKEIVLKESSRDTPVSVYLAVIVNRYMPTSKACMLLLWVSNHKVK